MVNRTECAADLIARSGEPRTEHTMVMDELALLGEGPSPRIVGSDDGHWRWLLSAPDGTVAAQCPAVHRDPVACQEAFADARRAAVTVLRRDRCGSAARRGNQASQSGDLRGLR
ncbi:hypothetical protein [Krasilnikovia sp. MM14-A1259]|uniref:hypothetical protein n=1 Tax=Krasilnikovia sp. MM14-A1259 TaxID=3373539 RepID=UPI003829C30E